ncbi:unnamed protein product [Thelazia callipaeda]|uniref:Transthyretin-like family protein n=1 Tax=Thelazia callipaeda TaxID=103827 RepID=A0A0N5CSV9_THECL|nr:unnamed protein product [Thelazia callipaeda]
MLLLLTVWIGMVLQANAFIQFAPFFQRLQCVGAVGQLTCNGRPSPNVPVRLIEEDSGIFDRDDLMSETRTDGAGFFRIYGCEEEILNITPKLNILHDCNDETTVIFICCLIIVSKICQAFFLL